jgi:hypothetical protein
MRNSPLRAFASPLKQDKKDKSKKETKSKDTEWKEVPGSRTTEVMGTKEDEKNLRKSMKGGGLGKEGMKGLLDDF